MSKLFNSTNKKIVLGAILIVVIIGASYGAYTLYFTPDPENTQPQNTTVTIVDGTGVQVEVALPVERIVCLNPGLTEIICALGCEDRIVGRDASSLFPDCVLDKPIVGENSYSPNIELVLEKEPDLVVADSMLSYNTEALETLENAGVPVIIEEPSNVTRVKSLTNNFGLILDKEAKATEIVDLIDSYENLVKDRVAGLTESEKTSVYIEWHTAWQTFSEGSAGHEILDIAGGSNIAFGESGAAPTLSPEYVAEENPAVIIRMIGQSGSNITEFNATRNEIMGRSALSEADAVKDGKVYVYDPIILEGLRYPVGLLYVAKWLHPTLFTDIDPVAVHEEMIQDFFGITLEGVYAYPFEPVSPKETITVVDKTGAAVNITTPVERIVAIIGTEFICALGSEDKIVGRAELTTDEEAIVPSSVLDLPVVAETSFSVNLELVLEQEPDLVLASEGLDDDIREQLEDAGVPVLEESTTYPRRETFIQNLGLILDAEEEANDFLEFETYYENIVKDRVANLTESEKPTVFFERYMSWHSSGGNGSYNEMISTAGGINIAAEEPYGDALELSPEYVAEENPDMILRMLTFYDGEDLVAYQTLRDDLLSRPALTDNNAVKSEQVYVIKNTVLVARRPIGLLYLAKWFHPDLFEDIDPAAIHEEYVQKFFGTEVSGVFIYPDEPTEPEPQPESITVVDGTGEEVTIDLPVERIVSVNSGLTEILCSLGCEDRIVGRDQSSTSSSSVLDIPVIAENSYMPNVELILELEPDLLVADSMLPYNTELYDQLVAAGIIIFIADTTDPEPSAHSNVTVIDFSCDLVSTIASIVGEYEASNEYTNYVQYYNGLVKERLENLTEADMPKVLLEWYQPYQTFVTPRLDQAGGINIAENQTEYAPILSAEFVVEQNPDIIICAISSNGHTEADFVAMRDEIMSRPELSEVNAVKNGSVYVYDFDSRGGIRCVVGYLYWAKWCQPSLFEDIDPAAVNAELSQKFLGTDTSGVYAYP